MVPTKCWWRISDKRVGGKKSGNGMEPVSMEGVGGREMFPCLEGATNSEGINRNREETSGDQGIRGECSWGLPHKLGLKQAHSSQSGALSRTL